MLSPYELAKREMIRKAFCACCKQFLPDNKYGKLCFWCNFRGVRIVKGKLVFKRPGEK